MLVLDFALPQYQDAPAQVSERYFVPAISIDIRLSLCRPEFGSCGGFHFAIAAIVAVPKTPVNEDDCPKARQDDIRFTGQVLAMEPETISERVEKSPDGDLWLRVLTAIRYLVSASREIIPRSLSSAQ